jgi:hypothetical protein
MTDTTQYLVFIKSAFSQEMTSLDYDRETKTHRPLTKRQYIDRTFQHLLKVSPDKFVPVKPAEFIKDYALGPRQSVIMARLGWDYPKAVEIIQKGGSILMYTCHLSHPWHFIAMDDFIHNDKIALHALLELGKCVGLETIFVEYNPENNHACSFPKLNDTESSAADQQ